MNNRVMESLIVFTKKYTFQIILVFAVIIISFSVIRYIMLPFADKVVTSYTTVLTNMVEEVSNYKSRAELVAEYLEVDVVEVYVREDWTHFKAFHNGKVYKVSFEVNEGERTLRSIALLPK